MKKFLGILFTIGLFVFLMPSAFAGTNAYSVDDLYFTNLSGTVLENPARSCVVNVKVTKQQLRFGNDDVIIASYATDGSLLGFTTVSGTIGAGETSVFKTLVTFPAGKTLGMVKAYVWNNVLGMQPLSNEATITVNEMDEGAEIISPVQEKYIPDTITIMGTVSEYSGENEYQLSGVYIPLDYDTYTREVYARYYAVSFYYNLPLEGGYGEPISAKSEVDLTASIGEYGEFTITLDENGNYKVLNFQPSCSRYVDASRYYGSDLYHNRIRFDEFNIAVATPLAVYINGIYYDSFNGSNEFALDAILSGAFGEIEFYKSNGTDYDTLYVDMYQIGQVSNVTYENYNTVIKFAPAFNNFSAYNRIEISDSEIENGDIDVSVFLDGEEIRLRDIREDDVIAVYAAVGQSSTIGVGTGAYGNEITILVSRETISGKVTAIEDGIGENAYTIGSTVYAAVDKETVGLMVGETYGKIYLDPFGRIYSYDEEEVLDNINYAILAKVTDRYDVTLVLPDGSREEYEVKNLAVWGTTAHAFTALEVAGSQVQAYSNYYYENIIDASYDVTKCVVRYELKNNIIDSICPVVGTPFYGEYKERASKIDAVGISNLTSIIDVSSAFSYREYKAMSPSKLVDEERYAGVGFGKIGPTTNYSLVILTMSGFDYNKNSRFAVVNANSFSQGTNEEGDAVDKLKVIVNGEKTELNFPIGMGLNMFYSYPRLGEAFFYTLDDDGLVNRVSMISLSDIMSTGTINLSALFGAGSYDTAKWGNTLSGYQDIRLVKGIVVEKTTNTVSLIEIPAEADGPVDINNYEVFDLADDCLIYNYDSDPEVLDSYRLDAEGWLVRSNFHSWVITQAPNDTLPAYKISDLGKIAWGFTPITPSDLTARGIHQNKFDSLEGTTASDYAQYALALIVDDTVVQIYEILQY